MYERVQFPRMQSSSVRIIHWKRELLRVHFQEEISQPRQHKTRFSGSTCCFSVALVTKKHRYFPGICDAAEGKAATPPTPVQCLQGKSTFLYSLLKSAANAVLKLMSAVIAIAHVLFVSMKSRSVNIMLLEYSFGRLKYSTTLPMSGFLGPDIKSRLEAGMSSCPSWAAQEGSSRSVLMYFALSRSTS